MNTNLTELFDFLNYIDDQSLEKIIEKSKEIHENSFHGFFGTSYGSNMKDMLSFMIAYEFLKNGKDLNKLIFAMTSYQEDFFNNTLIHLENLSCIFGDNLLPSMEKFIPHFIKNYCSNKKDFSTYEKECWLKEFCNNYDLKNRNFNYDTLQNTYLNEFLNLEKRILLIKLENKLENKETIKQRKI